MFKKGFHSTMLTSEVSDRLFSNITASNVLDQSFLSTLRILLHKRLPQNETVWLNCISINRTEQDISFATTTGCMYWFVPSIVSQSTESEYSITIVHAKFPSVGEKMLKIVRANAGTGKRYMSNYTRRDDLQVFYARKANLSVCEPMSFAMKYPSSKMNTPFIYQRLAKWLKKFNRKNTPWQVWSVPSKNTRGTQS